VHLKLTSATTGAPRLVAFTAEQLAADARHIVVTMGLRPEWPNLAAISLAHSYGFSNLILPLLLEGIPLLLAGSSLPEALRQATVGTEALTLPGVPALWRAWHEADAIPASTRLAISAGAPLPVELERAIYEAHGLKVHNFYGATECGGIAYDASTTPRAETAEVGPPMSGVTLTLGVDGCLEVRGDNVALGYWPESDARLGRGVFRTGDVAEWRAGRLWLRGRAEERINVAGRKLTPETVEVALLSHPAVRECVVFGVPARGGVRGEEPVAVVVTETPLDETALRAHLLTRLAAWQLPRRWWFVAGPLANERGKISRSRWRERFWDAAPGRRT
jgi:acyl-CoA synthetase (AMP-forming)/AMP-acid ligase II